jgi:class 3 adenylate cyclase
MLNRLNIRSKILLMLQVVSLFAVLLIAYLGVHSAREALRDSITNQLLTIRSCVANQLELYYSRLRSEVQTLSDNPSVVSSVRDFKRSYDQLEQAALSPDEEGKLRDWYVAKFLPAMGKVSEGQPTLEAYLPRRPLARYLQYHYLAANPNARPMDLNRAMDGSEYSRVHERYHPRFRSIVKGLGLQDLYLVDPDKGNIIYSVEKTADFATSLRVGPYAADELGEITRTIQHAVEPGGVVISDYVAYRPNFLLASQFLASPVFDGPALIGILCIQVASDQINHVLTAGRNWQSLGLGKTGEMYLVGQDFLLRSDLRPLLENADEFNKTMTALGATPTRLKNIMAQNTTRLQMEVLTDSAVRSLSGQSGVAEVIDYRGKKVLSAYQPFDVGNVRWGLIAKIDIDEAFAPITAFEMKILRWMVPLLFGVTLLSLWLARKFVVPIQKMVAAAKRVEGGDTDVQVAIETDDEFAELGAAFNQMVLSLRQQRETIQQQIEEKDALLLNILPMAVAKRYKEGEQSIAENYANVTVLYAHLASFNNSNVDLSAPEAADLLSDIFEAFDDAAERHGVETERSVGSSYLASCGLIQSRIDHVPRTLDFAQDLIRIVRAIEAERNVDLSVRIGISTGPVAAGIVGRRRIVYDLWGETVSIARRIEEEGKDEYSIIVTDAVRAYASNVAQFQAMPPMTLPAREPMALWSVIAPGNASGRSNIP